MVTILEFLVSLKDTETSWECVFVLIPDVETWGGCRLTAAADYDLPHALAEVWFYHQQTVSPIVVLLVVVCVCGKGLWSQFVVMHKEERRN